MGVLFGTDGIRGIANKDPMTPELGLKLGRAIVGRCENLSLSHDILIGRDTRISGEMLENALVSGILSAGGQALRAGIVPTPAVAYLNRKYGAGSGIVISASHNPYEHNGFKVFDHNGCKLREQDELELEDLILSDGPSPDGNILLEPGTSRGIPNAIGEYADFLLSSIDLTEGLKNIKVVLDCANGATFKVAPMVFERLGVQFKALFTEPDGKNINVNCGSQHTQTLAKTVVESGADVGLAFDGDGDRLIAVDEKGVAITGDQLLTIFSKMLKETGRLKANHVVSTVMSNIGLRIALESMEISHFEAQVGDRNVFQEMKRVGAVLGGEESGHIIFMDHHSTGDGLLSALQLLLAMNHFEKPLSELARFMTVFPQILVNIPVAKKPPLDTVPGIMEAIENAQQELKSKGRVLVRYSGTESLCRIMVEGEDPDQINSLANEIAQVVKKELS